MQKVWVALDPLPEVVAAACKNGVDLLITHHPLIFRPLSRIDAATPTGRIISQALADRLAVAAAHTNLDSAPGGLNDLLAERIGLADVGPLARANVGGQFKLVVFVPEEAVDPVMLALSETPAGRIGRYSGCSFRTRGIGSFRPEPGSRPHAGKIGEANAVAEFRVETRLQGKDLPKVLQRLREAHPYEEMAYDLYRLADEGGHTGIGRVGRLTARCRLADLARSIEDALGLSEIRMVGNPDLQVERVAVCTGSGSSLMKDFMASGAEVYVSGDLRYHDARDAEAAGRGLIDVGHFGSEHLMVEAVADRLRRILDEQGDAVTVEECPMERDPFQNP